ncbi:MAG: ATP-binding protein, partial [Bacteroidota bacterium]
TITKIVHNAETLVSNMSEIIWAMNSGFDTLESLIAYSRRYASQYLNTHDIMLDFRIEGDIRNIPMTGEQRRNVFLIIKEALHNTVKHAQAEKVKIEFNNTKELRITIHDNGTGFPDTGNILGNGLNNMKSRIEKLSGKITYKNDNGAKIQLTIPNLNKETKI